MAYTNEPITSLAAFKRRLRRAKTITMVNHAWPELSGPRIVERVQTMNAGTRTPGTRRCIWFDFPKRDALIIHGPNEVTIMAHNHPQLTEMGMSPAFTIKFDNPEVTE